MTPRNRLPRGLPVQVIRYSLIGVTNVIIDVGLLTVAVQLTGIERGPGLLGLASFSFACAIVNSYFWNARWTFGARIDVRRHAIRFVLVNLVGLGLTDAVIDLLTVIPHPWIGSSGLLHVEEAKAVAIVISAVWNFIGFRSFVFRDVGGRHRPMSSEPPERSSRTRLDPTTEVTGGNRR